MVKKNFTNAGTLATEAFFSNNVTDVENENENQNYISNNKLIEEVNHSQKSKDDGKMMPKTFNFKKNELNEIKNMTERYLGLRKVVNQSEILRMGISLIKNLEDSQLLRELEKLERVNIGRKSK